MMADDENKQSITNGALAILRVIAAKRLADGRRPSAC